MLLNEREQKVLTKTAARNQIRLKIKKLKEDLSKFSQHPELQDECLRIRNEIKVLEDELKIY